MNNEFESFLTIEQEGETQTINGAEGLKAAPPSFDPNVDLHTVTMPELYDTVFPTVTPLIDGLLYNGLYLFAGPPKTGKSFFMNQIGYHVAQGIPLWNHSVRKGTVLYLALEDNYARLQSRLAQMFGEDPAPNLTFAIQSRTLDSGLVEQMERFVQRNAATRLIIVDTLQKAKGNGGEAYSYAADYQNITKLKSFTDKHNICLLVVHHTRKSEACNSFDMISGTNGLFGAADGAIIMKRENLAENSAKMMVVGRDQESQELTLEFEREHCIWKLAEAEKEPIKRAHDPIVIAVAEYMKERQEWTGSATDLLEHLPELKIKPHALTRKLNVNVSVLYNDFGISYKQNGRSREKRTFTLRKMSTDQEKSDMD